MSIEAKTLLIKSKIYNALAIVFFVIGGAIFLALYIQNSDGDVMKALQDPATIVMVLFPFLPAVVFSYMASSAEKKGYDILEREHEKS